MALCALLMPADCLALDLCETNTETAQIRAERNENIQDGDVSEDDMEERVYYDEGKRDGEDFIKTATAGIKTYYTDTGSRYKHRSITKCCSSSGTVQKSKTSAAQMAYHWRAADILTATKYTYVIYQAQKTGSLQ